MAKPTPAECPGCNQLIRRLWRMEKNKKVGVRFRPHNAPCGLPCKTDLEAAPGQLTHTVTEECPECNPPKPPPPPPKEIPQKYIDAMSKIWIDGKIYDKTELKKHNAPKAKKPNEPPEPKVPWENIVIPPHALKMMKIRAGLKSVVDAANMIERLYPLTKYESSQTKPHGTSRTKRTMPGKNKRKSQRVDLYTVMDEGIKWTFYMKRNVLQTVHRNDDLDNIGSRSAFEILDEIP